MGARKCQKPNIFEKLKISKYEDHQLFKKKKKIFFKKSCKNIWWNEKVCIHLQCTTTLIHSIPQTRGGKKAIIGRVKKAKVVQRNNI